jgi:hypothetical protein
MPGGNPGRGSGFGRGQGQGMGMGRGKGQQGSGRGRMGGNKQGIGPSGNCICPGCGTKVPHKQGTPCFEMTCPKCGTNMMRE